MNHDMELLAQITATRLFVLQRAIAALIQTHPSPAEFAESFGLLTKHSEVEMLYSTHASEVSQSVADEFAQELLGLARDEAHRRKSAG